MDNNNTQQKPLSPIETEGEVQSRSERGRRSALKIKLLRIALGGSLSVFLLIILLMGFYIYRLSMEKEHISVELHKRRQQLGTVVASLRTLRHERDSLMRGKLPNLLPLEYDKVISLKEKYLRNITFTLTKDRGEATTEYRIVLQNNTRFAIRPKVKLLFFGDSGVQIGIAEMTPYRLVPGKEILYTESAADKETLYPGEIRSYSGSIELFRQGNSYHFLIIDSVSNSQVSSRLSLAPSGESKNTLFNFKDFCCR